MTKHLPPQDECRCRIIDRWCGNYATQEDMLCNDCRVHCATARPVDELIEKIDVTQAADARRFGAELIEKIRYRTKI